MDNRRDFLKKAALLAGAASLPGLIPESIQKAMAINAAPGSTYLDAEHIVILMQENRSFDHCYGSLKGVRGFNDPKAIDLPNKNKVWLQSNAAGKTYTPFRLDIKGTKATWMHSLPHSWQNQVDARNDGRYDQWLNVKRSGTKAYADMPLTMGYHTREDIPFYYALADAFTVCDQNFCSSLTGTNPNRLHFWTGTIRAEQNENSRAHVWNDDMDYGTLNWTTFPERLEERGVSWKCYQNEVAIDTGFKGEEDAWLSNFQDNPLEFFGQYHIHLYDLHVRALEKGAADLKESIPQLQKQMADLPAGDAKTQELKAKLAKMQAEATSVNTQLENIRKKPFDSLTEQQKSLHRKAFDTNRNAPDHRELVDLEYDDNGTKRMLKIPKGDVLHQFRADVDSGKLPTVSWISAPENFSDHPTSAWFGAWYVSEVIDILTKNPEVWKKTIFILAYDENDGYFDHVPPFVAPHSHKAGTGKVTPGMDTRVEFVTLEQEQARKGFPEKYDRESPIGLGFRVPLVIASPWSKGGWVNSEVFDHTSTLQFLEKFISHKTGKPIKETNISDWRRTICGDLTSVFRSGDAAPLHSPAPVPRKEFLAGIHQAKFKKLPDNYHELTTDEITTFNSTPHASPYMPKQEAGIKPSCSIPYQLQVDGRLSADKKSFEIKFDNKNEVFGKATAGAPFNVYAPGNYMQMGKDQLAPLRTWAYGLKPGTDLADQWPLHEFEHDNYHLRVYGPNGFYREFMGNAEDPQLAITLEYQRSRLNKNTLTGNVSLRLNNLSGKDYTVEINHHGYHNNNIKQVVKGKTQGEPLIIDLQKNHGWYDFSVKVNGHNSFAVRYAGRVETGKSSFTDPVMGGVV
ncbi:phospholipase C, phosphocholine-specific [Mucilaginibacter mali]|uniref:phospholipase C n=1 Tax=Mucilaginibacter mali TaxID=2740462 RepID=A0A7D4UE40_9SPHI|nr:phospholipase C, phosphocholine-specific [Mucilaginibacter mali]QKJ28556.1 phospholipase C, phosphocholine-specific [Mucilaginibacter mali]